MVKKDWKTTLLLLSNYATDVEFSSSLSLPWLFCSRTVFLCFHPFLVSVLFIGSSLLALNFYRYFFTPSFNSVMIIILPVYMWKRYLCYTLAPFPLLLPSLSLVYFDSFLKQTEHPKHMLFHIFERWLVMKVVWTKQTSYMYMYTVTGKKTNTWCVKQHRIVGNFCGFQFLWFSRLIGKPWILNPRNKRLHASSHNLSTCNWQGAWPSWLLAGSTGLWAGRLLLQQYTKFPCRRDNHRQ